MAPVVRARYASLVGVDAASCYSVVMQEARGEITRVPPIPRPNPLQVERKDGGPVGSCVGRLRGTGAQGRRRDVASDLDWEIEIDLSELEYMRRASR